MFRFLRKHKTILFTLLAAVIIVLPFFPIGTSFFYSTPHDTVVKVNGENITKLQFDRLYHQLLRQKTESGEKDQTKTANQAFQELIRLTVYDQEAKKYGLKVTDLEVQNQLANTPAFQKEGRFDLGTYYQILGQVLGTTPDEFEKARKKDIAAMKLNQLIASSVHVSDLELNNQLQAQLQTEKDSKKKKELMDNPETLREELRGKQLNLAYNDWLNQVNSNLKVTMVSENFKKQLSGAAPADGQ